MRFTSKFKKKINGFSKKSNKNESLDKSHCQDGCAQNRVQSYVANLKYGDCKYCKFVPRVIGQDHYDLVDLYDINISDSKQRRLKHLKIITRFIFSSAFCIRSKSHTPQYILHLNKEVENDTKNFRAYASDKDTMHMVKLSKEFQKILKKTSRNADVNHLRDNNAEFSVYCQKLNLNIATHQVLSERDTFAEGADSLENERLSDTESNNNSALQCYGNLVKSLADPETDECCLSSRTCNDCNRIERHELPKRSCVSKQSVCRKVRISGSAYGNSNQVLEIQYSSRFGEINERHCNAVMRLVNQRLARKYSTCQIEVCFFFQEEIEDSRELTYMRLDLIYKCLNAYFFPGNDVVTVSVQRDLKQFLYRTVFQSTNVVKDLFGERHYIDDDLNIRAVLMVSKSISDLMRHKDVCLLDTLPVILGIDRDTLLVIRH